MAPTCLALLCSFIVPLVVVAVVVAKSLPSRADAN